MKIGFYTTLLFWSRLIPTLSAARILGLFHVDGRSHMNFYEAMMKSLLDAGHHVTIWAPISSMLSHENYTSFNFINRREDEDHPFAFATRQKLTSLTLGIKALYVYESYCRQLLKFEKQINVTGNFDIIFVEMLHVYQCVLPLAKKSGIPVIGTISLLSFAGSDLPLGNPRNPSILPVMATELPTKMSFFERIENVIEEIKMYLYFSVEAHILSRLGEEFFPDQDILDYEISLLFINSHPSILPTALTPNTVDIGGINVKSSQLQPLPEALKAFIEGAENGVVLFSLGTITSSDSVEPEVLTALIRAFAKIPQRVLWKFSGQLDGLSENVLMRDWLPQKEILAHENVKAFISHCGISSLYEAVYFGKPLILMPVFADQPGNTGLLTSLKVGKSLDFAKVTEKELLEALDEVINSTTYRENMEKLSRIFKDEPISPSEKVLFWTEYLLSHNGTAHLRSEAVNMPVHQYLLLDIIVFFISAVILASLCVYILKKLFITE